MRMGPKSNYECPCKRQNRGHRDKGCEDGGREWYIYKPGNIRAWGPHWDL